MSTVSFVMILLSVISTAAGLPCCMGCLNWIAVPISLATAVTGVFGLALDKSPDGKINDSKLHLSAVIVGMVAALIGAVRCLAGGTCV